MAAGARVTAVEYGDPVPLVDAIATTLNVDREEARRRIRASGRRLTKLLRLPSSPFTLDGDDVRVEDVAGLIRIAPRVEIEVAPKFLRATDALWREDFFYISLLSHHGHVLASENVGASPTSSDDLATLIARAFVTMYWTNHRRPLRTYRRARVVEFALDGDVDPEDLHVPGDEGYEQRIVTFDRGNLFNAAILGAAQALLPEVREPGTRRRLSRLIEVLAPQRIMRRPEARRLPSRARRWQPLHDLSIDILRGLGLAFEPGRYGAPGFVMDTAGAWEALVTTGLRIGFGSPNTRAQRGISLGQRIAGSAARTIHVKPDVVLSVGGIDRVVLDAKYKGRADDDRSHALDADLYQALAFARASRCSLVVLLYPHRGEVDSETGATHPYSHDESDGTTIVRARVVPRGISARGGLRTFAKNLAAGVRAIAAAHGEQIP